MVFTTLRQAAIAVLSGLVLLGDLTAQQPDPSRSPVHRSRSNAGESPRVGRRPDRHGPSPAAVWPTEFRTIDGVGNNLHEPQLGAAGATLLRLFAADYGDGLGSPAGAQRPSPRLISNFVSSQVGDIPNALGASDFLWQWGQFLDHDIDETPIGSPGVAFDIAVPLGDMYFDPQGTGTVTIPMDRSAWVLSDGVRQQINEITAFIDASNVYGSESTRADALRALDGSGRLLTSAGGLLPFNVHGLPNAPASTPNFFLAGDIRANEQVGLTAMHTLFVREHNFWAVQLAQLGIVDGDLIYELSRAMVAAEMQAITFREFLPVLLGPGAIREYRGYRSSVDPGIANLFATAAYRVGHTVLSSQILRLEAGGNSLLGPLPLADAFFAPDTFTATGIEPILRGLAAQVSQDVDPFVVDGLRNFLFGPPGSGGFDLVSLNINRGRDHGLPSYTEIRMRLRLGRVNSFGDLTDDPVLAGQLASVYTVVDDIDAWVGLLAEDHRPGSLVGPTLSKLLRNQFERLRDGDRFWYEAYLPPALVAFVEAQTLATIIRRNTTIGSELADDVFRVTP